MAVRLTRHARDRMLARGVTEEWIEAAIAAPDRTEREPADQGLVRYFKAVPEFEGRVLRVVARLEPNGHRVITAFFDIGERRRRSEP